MDDLSILRQIRNLFYTRDAIKAHNKKVDDEIVSAVNKKIPQEFNNRKNAWSIYKDKKEQKKKAIPRFLSILYPAIFLVLLGGFSALSYAVSANQNLGLIVFLVVGAWFCGGSVALGIYLMEAVVYSKSKAYVLLYVLYGLLALAVVGVLFFSLYNNWENIMSILPRRLGEFLSISPFLACVISTITLFATAPIAVYFFLGKTSWLILLFLAIFITVVIVFMRVSLKDDYDKAADRSLGVLSAKQYYDKQYAIWKAAYNETKPSIAPLYEDDYWVDDIDDRLSEYYNNPLPPSDINLKTINSLIWCIENRYAYDIVGAKQWLRVEATINKFQAQIEENARKQRELLARNNEENERRHQEQLAALRKQNSQLEKLNDTAKKNLEANQNAARELGYIDTKLRHIAYH